MDNCNILQVYKIFEVTKRKTVKKHLNKYDRYCCLSKQCIMHFFIVQYVSQGS